MTYTQSPQRRSAFERTAADLGLIHGRSDRGCPWQKGWWNAATDKEELFDRERFEDSEHRRYRLWLQEAHYNHQRPGRKNTRGTLRPGLSLPCRSLDANVKERYN